MLYLASTQFLVALLLFTISIAFFWPPKTRTFTRRGWDPGLWGLKMWPARLYFFFKGHDIVETAYRDVCYTHYYIPKTSVAGRRNSPKLTSSYLGKGHTVSTANSN